MKNLLVLLSFVFTFSSFAQKSEQKDKGMVYSMTTVDKKPEYKGGSQKLISDLNEGLKKAGYESTKLARVGLVFVVEKDGSLSDIQILNAPNNETEEAVKKILTTLPNFVAGKYKSKDVRVMYSVLLKEEQKMRTLEVVGPVLD